MDNESTQPVTRPFFRKERPPMHITCSATMTLLACVVILVLALSLTACQQLSPFSQGTQAPNDVTTTTPPVLLADVSAQSSKCDQWCHNGWCAVHCDDHEMP